MQKTLTATLFAKPTAKAGSIMDRVKTFEDACEVTQMFPGQLSLNMEGDFSKHFEAVENFIKAIIINEALNEGWVPDWTDSNQYKYYPWFDMSSGSGLAYDDCADCRSDSTVGSRLCFKSRELAEYAGKQFIDIYSKIFIIKKP